MSKETNIEEENNEMVSELYKAVKKMLLKNKIHKLYAIGFNDIALIDPTDWNKELLDILFLDENVTDETRNYVFRCHDRDLNNINGDYISGYKYGRWHELYEFYLNKSMEYDRKDCVKQNVDNIIDFNMIAINKGKPSSSHYLIKVSSDTLSKLKAFDEEQFTRLNEMNKRIDGPTIE